jgi:hypothetical protein
MSALCGAILPPQRNEGREGWQKQMAGKRFFENFASSRQIYSIRRNGK